MQTGKYTPAASITLMYPNKTTVVMQGDQEIIKQLVDALNGLTITWRDDES